MGQTMTLDLDTLILLDMLPGQSTKEKTMKSITLGDKTFTSHKLAKEYIRAMLDRIWATRDHRSIKQSVHVKDKADFEFLKILFKLHPERKEKWKEAKGHGPIVGFTVGRIMVSDALCFLLRNKDGGARVPFSFSRCVKGW